MNITSRPCHPLGDEKEVIFWIQGVNSGKAHFHSPEMYILRKNTPHRFAIKNPRFLKFPTNWGGSYYKIADGVTTDTTPTNEIKGTPNWKVNGLLVLDVKQDGYYNDLWNERFSLATDEKIVASIWVRTEGNLRVRVGADFWGANNRPVYSEWVSGDWQRIFI